jgi:outer membrane receptor protein involved in Fe transport
MRKSLLSLITFLIFCSVSFSQGIIRGKITDENGEPVTGATIVVKSQPTVGTLSDLKGQFSLKISGSTPQIILISYVGYKTIEEDVNPTKGEIIVKDFNLVPASVVIQDAVVVGNASKSKEIYMEKIKSRSVLSLDYISSETIKKTGDINVSSAVARISGVSTNGSFITVRGMGDRYIKTAINGSRVPTLDPFTNNIKLDLFPASLVDNIVITKTASPDLPSDWAGAYLSVETKEYPEKLSINIETSVGYNDHSTFKDVVSSQRSSTDWLGFDNGLRDIKHSDFVPVDPAPGMYDEFVALGMADYFKSLGVTKSNWDQNPDIYTKLGYEQLGLIGKSQFNDNTAFTNAQSIYNRDYKKHADDLINAPGIKSQSRLFPDNWKASTRKAPLNFSQSFSLGNQTTFFGKPLGYLAGFRYSRAIQYDANSIGHPTLAISPDDSLKSTIRYDTTNIKSSNETNGWSALLNVAWKYHRNHSVSFLFMPNIVGVNKVRDGWVYYRQDPNGTINFPEYQVNDQFYEERKQMVYQLKSMHYLPGPKAKIELIASYTKGHSKAPDFKHSQPGTTIYHRYFRYLEEKLFDSRISAELPLGKPDAAANGKVKFGVAYQYAYRKNDQYDYIFNRKNEQIPFTKVDSTLNLWYSEFGYPSNHGFGNSNIKAGFMMLDYAITNRLKFSGGVRAEQAVMYTDVALYDSLGLQANDDRRADPNGIVNKPGTLNKLNYLPSANIILKLKHDDLAPVNLRFSYSQTLARPSLREISDINAYDYELKANVRGNPDLKMVQISNYDMRFEAYFGSGDNISVSAFYKDIKNHIAYVNYGSGLNGAGFRWVNSRNSWLKGIEIEGKKVIIKQLELRLNVTFVDSRSTVNTSFKYENGSIQKGEDITSNMYGQAPYIINGMLAYTSEKTGFSAALSYNRQGPRIILLGMDKTDPDIYEMPRDLLDFKASKSLGKHFGINVKVQDILSTSIRRTYKFTGNEKVAGYKGYILDYDKYTWGTNYVLAITYKL